MRHRTAMPSVAVGRTILITVTDTVAIIVTLHPRATPETLMSVRKLRLHLLLWGEHVRRCVTWQVHRLSFSLSLFARYLHAACQALCTGAAAPASLAIRFFALIPAMAVQSNWSSRVVLNCFDGTYKLTSRCRSRELFGG